MASPTMASPTLTFETKAGPFTLEPAGEDLIAALADHWPLTIERLEDGGRTVVVLPVEENARRVFGMTLPLAPAAADEAERQVRILRAAMGVALLRNAPRFTGFFLLGTHLGAPCDGYEDGGRVLPLPHGMVTFACSPNQWDEPENPCDMDHFALNLRCWGKFPLPTFGDWPTFIRELAGFAAGQGLSIPIWKRAPGLPATRLAGLSLEFLVIDGRVACVQENPSPDDPLWEMLAAAGHRTVLHLPIRMTRRVTEPVLTLEPRAGVVVTRTVIQPEVLHRRQPSEGGRAFQIVVPGMVGTVSYSDDLDWPNGFVPFKPLGRREVFFLGPSALAPLGRAPDAADEERTTRLWADRLAIAQKELGRQSLIDMDERVITEDLARQIIIMECQDLPRALDRGARSGVRRNLVANTLTLLRGFAAQKPGPSPARDLYVRLEEACADRSAMMRVAVEILAWLGKKPLPPRTGVDLDGPPVIDRIPFLQNQAFRYSKLRILHAFACSLEAGRRSSRDEILNLAGSIRGVMDHSLRRDDRFAPDQLVRNMIDIGYLDRDVRGLAYWLKVGPTTPTGH